MSIQQESQTTGFYDCPICRDSEFVYLPEKDAYKECSCRQDKQYIRLVGSNEYKNYGFKNFSTQGVHQQIKDAKNLAISYAKNFKYIHGDRNNSIAFFGSVIKTREEINGKRSEKRIGIGSGKTHLCFAILNNLSAEGVPVTYMPYVEAITNIKQVVTDEEMYIKAMSKYKSASVLFIDDLFKSADGPTPADIRHMYNIIDYRYVNRKPMIISSEWGQEDLLHFDEATASRIIQMCRNYIVQYRLTQEEIKAGTSLNYRLR